MASNTITLAEIRTNARYRAGMENSTFVTDDELNVLANRACAELYDLLVSLDEDYYTTLATGVAATSGPISLSALSTYAGGFVPIGHDEARCLKLRKVEYQNGADWIRVRRIALADANRVDNTQWFYRYGTEMRWYAQIGNLLYLYPSTGTAFIYRLWYVPQWQDLDDTNNPSTDRLQNWVEYAEIRAAMQMLRKEESDTSELAGELAMLRQRIIDSASQRDFGAPSTILDVTTDDYGDWGSR